MKCYFLGIAGAGVSALAFLLKSEGYEVSGSDEGVFAPVSTYLDELNIKYHTSFDAANVPPDIDIAIIGTTAKIDPETNPELREIISRNIPYYSFAEFLGFHTKTRQNLIVAGSFGKSSLTALITNILIKAGKSPGWFVGAIAKDLPQTGFWGKDPEFIMEGDEYVTSLSDRRSKFELYYPNDILLSSIVHDHVNMFPTMGDYESRFRLLIDKLPPHGILIAANSYEPIHRLARQSGKQAQVIWYGLSQCDGYYCENIKIGEITCFDLITPNHGTIPLKTTQLGEHNIENIIGAAAYLLSRDLVSAEQLQNGVFAFQGVTRRLDKKTKFSRVPAYEGFGSSYEKARSAIEAIKLHFPTRKMIIVFEPHTFSWRNRESLHWYDKVFIGAHKVLMLAPPQHGASKHDQLSLDEIITRAKNSCADIVKITDCENAIEILEQTLIGNEVILLLSSGPLDGLPEKLPEMLEAKFN